jgi:hypothetical protein
MVGIFYYIDGQFYIRPRTKSRVQEENRCSNVLSWSAHFSFWMDIRNLKPEWKKLDDSYFSRGRIIYEKHKDRYLLTMDKCIPESEIPEILDKFNLRRVFLQENDKIRIVRGQDPESGIDHYKCQNCDPVNRKRVL